jgi:predicted DNA-binding transcriptional regulator AlpA
MDTQVRNGAATGASGSREGQGGGMRLRKADAVAEMFGVKQARIYDAARQGIFPAGVVVRLGRQIRFDVGRIEEWARDGGQPLAGGWRRDPDGDAP